MGFIDKIKQTNKQKQHGRVKQAGNQAWQGWTGTRQTGHDTTGYMR